MGALVRERPEVLAPELGVSGATPYRWKHQALIDPVASRGRRVGCRARPVSCDAFG